MCLSNMNYILMWMHSSSAFNHYQIKININISTFSVWRFLSRTLGSPAGIMALSDSRMQMHALYTFHTARTTKLWSYYNIIAWVGLTFGDNNENFFSVLIHNTMEKNNACSYALTNAQKKSLIALMLCSVAIFEDLRVIISVWLLPLSQPYWINHKSRSVFHEGRWV